MANGSSRTLQAGGIAPDIVLRTPEGEPASLTSLLAAGPVLLAFYRAGCPVCQLALPFLDRLKDAPFRVFNVSQDSAGDTRRFAREFGLSTPALLDPERDGYPASNAFGITHVPSMFLIGAGGQVEWASTGFYKNELLDLAARAGAEIFRPGEWVPEAKAG
jgi:peroxiredoxin